jgi:hypothetical protein
VACPANQPRVPRGPGPGARPGFAEPRCNPFNPRPLPNRKAAVGDRDKSTKSSNSPSFPQIRLFRFRHLTRRREFPANGLGAPDPGLGRDLSHDSTPPVIKGSHPCCVLKRAERRPVIRDWSRGGTSWPTFNLGLIYSDGDSSRSSSCVLPPTQRQSQRSLLDRRGPRATCRKVQAVHPLSNAVYISSDKAMPPLRQLHASAEPLITIMHPHQLTAHMSRQSLDRMPSKGRSQGLCLEIPKRAKRMHPHYHRQLKSFWTFRHTHTPDTPASSHHCPACWT